MKARANTLVAERRAKEAGDVRIGLLGGFSVTVDDRKVAGSAWRLRKAASLIKLLALAPSHRLHRERAMDLLWRFACVAAVGGETVRAVRLWGAAQALHESQGIPRDTDFLAEADVRISTVRSGMGEEVWEEAWRKG